MFEIFNRRYTGSKHKVMPEIRNIILKKTSGDTLIDIFGGTGAVVESLKDDFQNIVINDFLFSNEIIYKGFFGKGKYSKKKIEDARKRFNSINPINIEDNYFSTNFGNNYFSLNDARLIGWIREELNAMKKCGEINDREFSILLASLVYSADKIANTVGHYDAYRKRIKLHDRFKFILINPWNNEYSKKINIYRDDANDLIRKVKGDVLFVDPPYNSRQYSRFYHVLENLVEWKKPELYGVAKKPAPENMSSYSRTSALNSFKELVENAKVSYIVTTYNNTYNPKSSSSKNKISYQQLLNTLNHVGKTEVFRVKNRFFSAGKTDFKNHYENVFVTKVGDKDE